jgi:hypothetical protein
MVKGRKQPSKKQGGKANDPKLSQEQEHKETSTDYRLEFQDKRRQKWFLFKLLPILRNQSLK